MSFRICALFAAVCLPVFFVSCATQEPSLLTVSAPEYIPAHLLGVHIKRYSVRIPPGYCLSLKEIIFRDGKLSESESIEDINFVRDHEASYEMYFMTIAPDNQFFAIKDSDHEILMLPSGRTIKVKKGSYKTGDIFSDTHLKTYLESGPVGLISLMYWAEGRDGICRPFNLEDAMKAKLAILIYLNYQKPDPNDSRYARFYLGKDGRPTYSFRGAFPLPESELSRLKGESTLDKAGECLGN